MTKKDVEKRAAVVNNGDTKTLQLTLAINCKGLTLNIAADRNHRDTKVTFNVHNNNTLAIALSFEEPGTVCVNLTPAATPTITFEEEEE
ncbi:hypothetical protein JR316_0005138 [Psilocybe cubensis]|uniref:Uncharacterized protein n=2 Tax=Psilocybe cubensis TaxID=181762 RepID=A0A8H7Y1V7_PSICU|nr:hypothetical protein JR316_0005138 [Psilocybe cubensis]KAH9483038.1 hypothetical protein JR316_0005138 [Psilocybe cubensis]